MIILDILVGAALLTLGRKFFWFFVAATGFYAGLEIASRYMHNTPGWLAFLIAIVIGLLGALVAYFAQKLVIAVAGFLAGVFISSRMVALLAPQFQAKNLDWLIYLIAGIIGIVLMLAIFEWALIFFSSIAGAILIVEALNLAGLVGIISGVILFVGGVIFQSELYRRRDSTKEATG